MSPPFGSGDGREVIDRYFALSLVIEQAKADKDYRAAIQAARETYALLPEFVVAWKREMRGFGIGMSHAVHTAPTLMAVLGEAEGIRELRSALEAVPDLHEWMPAATLAEEDLALVPRIVAVITDDPGVLQSVLKTKLELPHGKRASQLVAWLEKAAQIVRVKKGSSYLLYKAGHPIPTAGAPRAESPSPTNISSANEPPKTPPAASALLAPSTPLRSPHAWTRRSPEKARLVELSGLPVVRLPRAPLAWEQRDAQATTSNVAEQARGKGGQSEFVIEGPGWTIGREEKLTPAERPDPAFKEVFHSGRYTHWLDSKGKREGFEHAASVLRVTDREGRVNAERGLGHDVYRSDVNADGTGILFLSREGVLHGYTETLAPCLEVRLIDLPEYQAQAERLGIAPRELKNHTRCVAISLDRKRYLVTVVDEAWCLDTVSGDIAWGLRMPAQEGWIRRVAARTDRVGTSLQVESALRLMKLELPVTPDEIIRQYRALAMQWHPDRNPGDPGATARFQDLGAAMELLTGADLSQLSGRQAEQVTYEQVLSTTRVTIPDGHGGTVDTGIGITFGIGMSEKSASDWIYAANLGRDGRAFLATYAGKVVIASPEGVAERVYDIGAVPRHIVDAGEHLYILTDTRLYVLSGDHLEALVDVYGAGDLVVTDSGFALLEPKSLTWFAPNGKRVGAVVTKAPLRRAFSTSAGLVVETRQRRAVVAGPPAWWR